MKANIHIRQNSVKPTERPTQIGNEKFSMAFPPEKIQVENFDDHHPLKVTSSIA